MTIMDDMKSLAGVLAENRRLRAGGKPEYSEDELRERKASMDRVLADWQERTRLYEESLKQDAPHWLFAHLFDAEGKVL